MVALSMCESATFAVDYIDHAVQMSLTYADNDSNDRKACR